MKRVAASCFLFAACVLAGCGERSAADRLVERVTRGTGGRIETRLRPQADSVADYFALYDEAGRVVVEGDSPVSIATGVNWYLKYRAGVHIAWNNLSQPLLAALPPVGEPVRCEASGDLRYYLNYCTYSYSMAFWDWARWEREIDWMALHGVNLVLDITGMETVWYNLLQRLGYTPEEAGRFIAGPAFLAWWHMNNLEGWGGPNPEAWYAERADLHRRIAARLRELGIEPVFPGYAGMVPRDIAEKMDAAVSDPGKWCGFDRPAYLSPDDEAFGRIADLYYEELEKLYGKACYYSMDPFHEGGSTEGVDLRRAGSAVLAAMKRANPEAVWVIQGWQENPRYDLIAHLPKHDLLVLDLYADKLPKWGDPDSEWYDPRGFFGHDWIYCMLLNFGGRGGMHGRMERLVDGFYDARASACGGQLRGTGMTPEAIGNNPVMFELLSELPWRGARFDAREWLADYLRARYGADDADVRAAWTLLYAGPYNDPVEGTGDGAVESLFCARPGLHLRRASTWGHAVPAYPDSLSREAARHMLAAAGRLGGNPNFRYDLVDAVRQAIADWAYVLHGAISEAYDRGDREAFAALSETFVALGYAQDRLLATMPGFRLDEWIGAARALSPDPARQALDEWNARTLVTTWGPREETSGDSILHDYSLREWSGLLGTLYMPRWERYFAELTARLDGAAPQRIDFFAMEEAWARRTDLPERSGADPVATARAVFDEAFGPRSAADAAVRNRAGQAK